MKRSFYLILSIVAVSIFGISSISLAGTHEAKPQAEATPKITAKDAKHTVLFAYPGCTVEKCEMVKGKDHTNWAVSAVKAGASTSVQVQVDGVTGKIIP
jgi:hypothetical protein